MQTKLRKSEEDEMARLIGKDLIDNLEDLRTEFENLVQINKELDERNKKPFNKTQSTIFSQTKNANFLNKELMFMLEELQEKAAKNGLSPDALIPLSTKKDVQIFNYLKQQQESSSDQTTMRSSFYSTATEDLIG